MSVAMIMLVTFAVVVAVLVVMIVEMSVFLVAGILSS
jgi:hypothetical protein